MRRLSSTAATISSFKLQCWTYAVFASWLFVFHTCLLYHWVGMLDVALGPRLDGRHIRFELLSWYDEEHVLMVGECTLYHCLLYHHA